MLSFSKISSLKYFFHLTCLTLIFLCLALQVQAQGADKEPIAYIGHGAFFSHDGKQIVPTLEFVDRAQGWYRAKLLSSLKDNKKAEFKKLEKRLNASTRAEGQARLVIQQHLIDWLLANSKDVKSDHRTLGKLNALKYALNWKLPDRRNLGEFQPGQKFKIDPELEKKLKLPEFRLRGIQVLSATLNLGQAYIDECRNANVPIPPPIGQMATPANPEGWVSQGFIPRLKQFIVGTPAELRTYKSSSPSGMCIALPRYTNDTLTEVSLDGVICLGQTSSKVCFWDNQMTQPGVELATAFPFPSGTKIPIGVPDLSINPDGWYQAGGYELRGNAGGICTDCHAGQNPYIIHPEVILENRPGGSLKMGDLNKPPLNLPTFSAARYDPLVPPDWPQNRLSHSQTLVPAACSGCHRAGGSGGAFPHLSSDLNEMEGYCKTILPIALNIPGPEDLLPPPPPPPPPDRRPPRPTMPQFSPGSERENPAITRDFIEYWCGQDPTSGPSDRGDPHIVTTNGISYDFQAAGEFTVLKKEDTSFELQTRQSPVLTNFTPDANAYTGLASCVSLNTAVALRVGKRRITYQPAGEASDSTKQLQLRVDGKSVDPASGFNLGGGNVINKTTADGGIDISLADSTRIIVTPLFWASQGYWYLDVQALNTPAREGVMGHILAKDWLPRAPDGSSFGPKPASLLDRHVLLNQKFANAWRVSSSTSLFDYDRGTTTADFTDVNWPPESGKLCTSTTVRGPTPIVKEPRPDIAKKACRGIKDKTIYTNCIFDVTVMGDTVFANGYRRADKLKASATNTRAAVN